MKDFVEKDALTRRKINHWQESLENGEKNDFHWPESQLSTSNNELFLLKLLSPTFSLLMVSTSSEIASTKKYCFQ